MNAPAPTVIAQAAHWMAVLQSGEASADDEAACARWREADPSHELAWQRMSGMGEQLRSGLRHVPPAMARQTLGSVKNQASRRQAMKALAGLGALTLTGAGAWVVADPLPFGQMMADHATRAGEQRTVTLADGTRVTLNTATAIDVRFSATQRQLVLREGEIEIVTAPDPRGRPFEVATRLGRIAPLGTRFTVRDVNQDAGQSHDNPVLVAVTEGAVAISPKLGGTTLRLPAGQQTRFTATAVEPPAAFDPANAAWLDDMIVASDMPLPRFIAELGRYRRGILRCDPALSDLTVSGAFPLQDTDAVLALLQEALPVRTRSVTRYWVTVLPR
ncbi:FecR domain-containing protein [Cupriavidus sp. DL-D2]|uniref:FecR domain-containing protein n=1 Tax=Cupriavidus sp. DL-D2 TaxID=3144974 RepID=UPI0032125692